MPPDRLNSMERTRLYPGLGHALLLCVAVIAFQVGVATPFALAGLLLKSSLATHPAVIAFVNVVAFGLTLFLGLLLAKAPRAEVFPLKRVRAGLFAPMVLSVVGAVILLSEVDNLFRAILPIPEGLAHFFKEMFTPASSVWGSFLLLVLVAPVTEELLLRGMILRGFLSRYRAGTAIGLSALLFACLHLNPWQFMSALALGVLLAWWFVRTRSLVPCLAGHALANFVVLANPFLPFQIPGFNKGDMFSPTEFQPLWLDALGAALLGLGLLLFARMAPPPVAAPPILQPPVLGDHAGAVPPGGTG